MPKKDKKAKKAVRPSFKGVTKNLRAFLAGGTHTIPEMMAGLDVTEEAVLYGLRRLGKSKKGTLRSGMVEGRPCWWWEADDAAPGPSKAAQPRKK